MQNTNNRAKKSAFLLALGIAYAAVALSAPSDGDSRGGPASSEPGHVAGALQAYSDPAGVFETLSTTGRIDRHNAFFQSLGTNGRSCGTCHVPEEAFGLSAAGARRRFRSSRGEDPLFSPVDGANCPNTRRDDPAAHSLLTGYGVFHLSIPMPSDAEFTISVVHDPYGCALTLDPNTGQLDVSVYRRPLPATNLGFLSAVMIDGRETVVPLNDGTTFLANLFTDLRQQALDATLGHAQAAHPPTNAQLDEIVRFELGLYTAQSRDRRAGSLGAHGAQGGAFALANQPYYPGINDALGGDPSEAPFDPSAMTLYSAWDSLTDADAGTPRGGVRNAARRAIAAGEKIFDTAPLVITGVHGLNDNPALGKPASIAGHCTTCHDTPNVGDHSLALPVDIGVSHATLPGLESDPDLAAALTVLGMPDLPVYAISGCPDPSDPGRLATIYTSDPGRALITGRCSDVDLVKGPILRGLAARAPYFHNGSAATLSQVVAFYNERFHMQLTAEQKADLTAFLDSL